MAQPADSSEILARATALAPVLRERSEEIERARKIPSDIVTGLGRAGIFRLCVPRTLGGLEADVATLLAVLQLLAVADGSAGWCAMIGATSGLVSGYLEDAAAREVFGDGSTISGGVFAPRGSARRDGSWYVVSGRWPFASGCEHCNWLMGGCVVLDGTTAAVDEHGRPQTRMVLFPASDAVIHDTWDVSGLRGTGSHDIEVRALRVPAARSVSLAGDVARAEGALYRFPIFGLLALGIAAVALGIARRAIEELGRLAIEKTPTGAQRRLAERAVVQAEVARAEAAVESARAYLDDMVGRAKTEADRGTLELATRARLRLAATHATASAAAAVDRMYEVGGGTSIYARSPLQRCFRDVHVATQHTMVASPTYELAGRVLLGQPMDSSLL